MILQQFHHFFIQIIKSNLGLSSNIGHNLDDLNSSVNLDSAKGTAMPHYNTKARHKATAPVRPVVAEMTVTCLINCFSTRWKQFL